ncbi:ATP-binding cassette domain-containing protein [Streptomyces sp. NPDC088350]|uniref:ATP-binding cassette domain-containing protein n=1 Tax=Streptomyces sp. NPDC088350 TaxID=3365854 RepID=UPI00380B5FE6
MSEQPATTAQPLLTVEDLRVSYRRRRPETGRAAVDGVSLTIAPGETVGVVGESGSGKSTLARSLVGLTEPCGGRITFDGRDITRAARGDRRRLARHIQYVFQDPYSSLNPTRTVGSTLAEPLLASGRGDRFTRRAKIQNILELVGLPADAADHYPGSFSGGQRQRIAIARALVVSPRLVICDEPTSALDVSIQAQILRLLRDLQSRFGISYLFIAHNLDVVRCMADRTVVMRRGQVVEEGPSERIATRPTHPYTQALVAAMPLADPVAQRKRRDQRLPPDQQRHRPAADLPRHHEIKQP